MESRLTVVGEGFEGGGMEQKKKRLMDTDNRMVMGGREGANLGVGVRGINGGEKIQ